MKTDKNTVAGFSFISVLCVLTLVLNSGKGIEVPKTKEQQEPLVNRIELCDTTEKKDADLEQLITSYFETYKERVDLEKFLSFYDTEAVLIDKMTGQKVNGKEELRAFFDWSNPDFQALKEDALFVQEQFVLNSSATITGHFNPFLWKGKRIEVMRFKTILTFNEYGKIVSHTDWIDYPESLLPRAYRKDSIDFSNPIKR